jgi:uridine kinase
MRKRTSQIIAICGGSGSGKSTLAQKFVGAAVLSTDHFYRDLEELTPREDGSYDFDHPSSVDLEACAEACLRLADSEDAVIPVYDIATLRIFIDTPVDQRMARRLRRDVERGRSTLDTIRHSLAVEEAYTRYIEPMRHLADLILQGEEMRGGFAM